MESEGFGEDRYHDSVCETMAGGGLAVPPHPHFLSACGITVCFGSLLAVGMKGTRKEEVG